MATLDRDVTITWLGHSTFHFATATGTRLLLEAWVDTNPACPEAWKNRIREDGLDTILISHGHGDHIGDLHALADATGATIVGQFDITTWLATKN
ncbi:MAG TPA: MBL fold metallo-hydrolase, partial [Roseiflexaceae bacterium]|nr:MBL fold metallo-hydrolase [Roseiflexaceae bacterium]